MSIYIISKKGIRDQNEDNETIIINLDNIKLQVACHHQLWPDSHFFLLTIEYSLTIEIYGFVKLASTCGEKLVECYVLCLSF